MQKCFLLFVGVGLLFFYILTNTALAYGEAVVYISPLQGQYVLGQEFATKVWVKTGGYRPDHFKFDISYPEDFLEVKRIEWDKIFPPNMVKSVFDNSQGIIHLEAAMKGGMSEDASVATIYFVAKQKGSSYIDLSKTSRLLAGDLSIPFRFLGSSVSALIGNKNIEIMSDPVEDLEVDGVTLIPILISSSSVLNGNPVIIKGSTHVSRARVESRLEGGLAFNKVYADQDGSWEWSPPDKLLPGIYAVQFKITNPKDSRQQAIEWVEFEKRIVEAEKALYRVIIHPKNSIVRKGSQADFDIEIMNLAGDKPSAQMNFGLKYYVEDADGALLLDEKEESIPLTNSQLILSKQLDIANDAVEGNYTIYASLILGEETIGQDRASFVVAQVISWYYPMGIGAIFTLIAIFFILKCRANRT